MTALADLSEQVNRMTGGNSGTPDQPPFYIDPRVAAAAAVATIAGRWTSLWQYAKHPGGSGAVPGGTARNPTNATNGSMFQADPGGGRQKWLLGGYAGGLAAGSLLVMDRLADISGLNGTTTTAQTITGLSVTRYTGTESAGNMIALEIYTIIGTTGTTITAQYTNEAGTASRVTEAVSFGATGFREAQRWIFLPLQSGDKGVRSVENVDLVATTGTAGDFGVTIVRPLMTICLPNVGTVTPVSLAVEPPGLTEIKTGACVSYCWFPNGTTAPQVMGQLSMVER